MEARTHSLREVWKPIPGFPFYEASNTGHVRSIDRVITNKAGRAQHKPSVVLTEMVQSGKGYKRVNVYRNNKMEQHGVHCLVSRAFHGLPNGRYVNHIDFDVTNNHVDNLEYVTPHGNVLHSARAGRLVRHIGERNPMAILTESDVIDILAAIQSGERDKVIAARYGVHYGTIHAIRSRKNWKHVVPLGT